MNKFDFNNYGLTADKKGGLYLRGKKFCGYGVNSFTAMTRYIDDNTAPTFEEQFKLLKSYNIPFVRINFGGYYPSYYEKFDKDPAAILKKMHDVVACAEKYEIGLVCPLFWYDGSLSAYLGERRSAMGNPNSKTAEYSKKYIEIIVNEFKNSPAIWAWELGNEYNLDADLCDREIKNFLPRGIYFPDGNTSEDYYTSEELSVYMKLVGEEIRKHDKYRIISTGHGDMREASKSLHDAGAAHDSNHMWDCEWETDSFDDFCSMCGFFTPEPFNTLCFHIQHGFIDENGNEEYINTWKRFGGNITTEEYLKAYLEAAKRNNKVLYFGEMGDLLCKENSPDAPEFFDNLVKLCISTGVEFASCWQFASNGLVATDRGIDGEKLKSLQKANIQFAADGVQDLDTYWKEVKSSK